MLDRFSSSHTGMRLVRTSQHSTGSSETSLCSWKMQMAIKYPHVNTLRRLLIAKRVSLKQSSKRTELEGTSDSSSWSAIAQLCCVPLTQTRTLILPGNSDPSFLRRPGSPARTSFHRFGRNALTVQTSQYEHSWTLLKPWWKYSTVETSRALSQPGVLYILEGSALSSFRFPINSPNCMSRVRFSAHQLSQRLSGKWSGTSTASSSGCR